MYQVQMLFENNSGLDPPIATKVKRILGREEKNEFKKGINVKCRCFIDFIFDGMWT